MPKTLEELLATGIYGDVSTLSEDELNAIVNDDLYRVNCPHAGTIGHYDCGWCEIENKPRFACSHYHKEN